MTTPSPQPEFDPLAWAERLRLRELRCERLSKAQRLMWREALRERYAKQDEPEQGAPKPPDPTRTNTHFS